MGFEKVTHTLGFALPHDATCMYDGVVAPVRGGKGFACEVVKPTTELVMMSCDEADFCAVQHVI